MPETFKFKSSKNKQDEYCDNKLCWIVLIQQYDKKTHVSYQKCESLDKAIEIYENKLLYAIQINKSTADDFLHQLKTGNNIQKAKRGIESKVATLKAHNNVFSLKYFENTKLTEIIIYNNNEKRKRKNTNTTINRILKKKVIVYHKSAKSNKKKKFLPY